MHDEENYVTYLTESQLGGLSVGFIKSAARIATDKGQEGKYGTEIVGDVEAIQYWRDSLLTGLNAVYQKPIEELAKKIKEYSSIVF